MRTVTQKVIPRQTVVEKRGVVQIAEGHILVHQVAVRNTKTLFKNYVHRVCFKGMKILQINCQSWKTGKYSVGNIVDDWK